MMGDQELSTLIKTLKELFDERFRNLEDKITSQFNNIGKDINSAFDRLRSIEERLRWVEDIATRNEQMVSNRFDPWKKVQESFFSWLVPALLAMAIFAIQNGFRK